MVSTRGVQLKFVEGEKVLCYEPDPNKAKVLYDSKILERCVRTNSRGKKWAEYLVHFYGWNSSWDRFVPEQNILPNTAENRQLQRQLAQQAAESLKGKKLKLNKIPAIIKEVVVGNTSANNGSDDSSAKEGYDEDDETVDDDDNCDEDSLCNTASVGYMSDNVLSELSQSGDQAVVQAILKVTIPDELKLILEKDQETIDINKTLYSLPFELTIDSILMEYIAMNETDQQTKNSKDPQRIVILKEFVNSIEVYFNAICLEYLMYNQQERQQLEEFQSKHPNIELSETYGCVHLLRLLVALSDFLAAAAVNKIKMKVIGSCIDNLLEFLLLNKERFCVSNILQ